MERLKRVLEILESNKIEAFFISSQQNITYITGFTGDSSRLLISSQKVYLITDGRYVEQAQKECDNSIEVITWIEDYRYHHKTYGFIANSLGVSELCFEGNGLVYNEYVELSKINGVSLKAQEGIIEPLRMVKSKNEIEHLKRAGEISDVALEQTVKYIKPNVSEMDIVAELEYRLKKNGADNISFETMVLFGERSSLLHGKPGTRKLKLGDIILFDFGALYQGYHADISRVFVCGKASKEQLKVHDMVNHAGLKVAESLQSGISTLTINKLVREQIQEEYLQYLYPGIGHGTGLEIHELPFIKPNEESILKEGMIITIEPGLYIPNWGGMRNEDSILITKDGCEPLNKFNRDLQEVPN